MEGLPEVGKKPFFPHYYNKKQNLNVELDSLPSIDYYGPLDKPKSEVKELLKWHSANVKQKFCLKDALLEYCVNDTRILRYG